MQVILFDNRFNSIIHTSVVVRFILREKIVSTFYVTVDGFLHRILSPDYTYRLRSSLNSVIDNITCLLFLYILSYRFDSIPF